MDYNMEDDQDDIAKNHGKPQVVIVELFGFSIFCKFGANVTIKH